MKQPFSQASQILIKGGAGLPAVGQRVRAYEDLADSRLATGPVEPPVLWPSPNLSTFCGRHAPAILFTIGVAEGRACGHSLTLTPAMTGCRLVGQARRAHFSSKSKI